MSLAGIYSTLCHLFEYVFHLGTHFESLLDYIIISSLQLTALLHGTESELFLMTNYIMFVVILLAPAIPLTSPDVP